jgi:hypothetical protein
VNEKIQSLKSAQTVNDIKEVYPYIITEKDFSDAIKFSLKTIRNIYWKCFLLVNPKHFMGNRFGIFNYATKASGGYVDMDFFEYKRITQAITL